MKGKLILLGILLLAGILSTGMISSVESVTVTNTEYSSADLGLSWNADVYVTLKDSEGNVKYYYEGKNLLTDAGADAVKELVGNGVGTGNAWDYIAVGNGTAPTTGSTSLANEIAESGLSRSQGSYTDLGTGRWKIENIYTITGTVNSINSTGLFNASSSGNMIAGDTFANTNVINGDSLNNTWDITLS